MGGRFYDPTAGEVSLDGRPLRQLDLTWLRRQATPPPSALSVARQATPPVSPVALKMGGVTRMAGGGSLALRVSEFKLVEFRVCHHGGGNLAPPPAPPPPPTPPPRPVSVESVWIGGERGRG